MLDSNKVGSVTTSLSSKEGSTPINLFDKVLFIGHSVGLNPLFPLEFLTANVPFICCLLLVDILRVDHK